MASPPPAALGAGMAGEAALIVPVSSRVLAEVERPWLGDPVGKAQGFLPSQRTSSPAHFSAEAGAAGRPPLLPGRGPSLSAAPFRRRTAWNAGVFPVPRRVSAPWGWGRAFRANSPLPPGVVESGCARGGAPRRRGSLQAGGGDPSWLKHSWSAACLLGNICCRFPKPRGCPGGVMGGGGVLVCFCWKLRVLRLIVYAEILGTCCRRGALVRVVRIFFLLPK